MNTPEQRSATRQAAVNGLAVTGFVALIALGMWLAVYSARFVPNIVGSLSVAAVTVSQFFTPAKSPALSVVPTATSTDATSISFGDATTTPATSTPVVTKPAKTVTEPAAGPKSSTTYQIGGKTAAPATLSGLPDLVTNIIAVGYLQATSTDTFVATSSVPAGKIAAVKFVVKNVGTNTAAAWRFSASIPAQTAYIYQSQPQQTLNPGDSIEYTLGFDQATKGTGQLISITANFDHAVTEANANNNSASASITILGS